ncbi:hypothetical protein SE18_13680 [Herpetosiphon geysericola]|uniref:Uncharacterized protein n=1 Tax=Herpetosiphon geysericola TaxID=70996 RepID=A0A0P6Y0H5_9CHLR|nr:hypothetical protein SE18_13680 [Herpetosiphon geysericola]
MRSTKPRRTRSSQRGISKKHNNPQNEYERVLGDENPRRFPPAEGRKGGETMMGTGCWGSGIGSRGTAKDAKHTKGGFRRNITIPKTNMRGCWGMKTLGVSLRRRDGRVANCGRNRLLEIRSRCEI